MAPLWIALLGLICIFAGTRSCNADVKVRSLIQTDRAYSVEKESLCSLCQFS